MRKSQIFSVIERFSEKYTIRRMCHFYNVSRQGYYDYQKRRKEGNPDQELIDMITEYQNKNKNRLGYRRVQKWLEREKGLKVDDKKVYRITSRNNLLSIVRRRKTLKYKPNGNLKYKNLLNRRTRPPLLHSDGGGQYRSYDHKNVIEEYGLKPSMSKPATPGDNAMAENFFSIFKTECIYLEKPKNLDEALALTDEFLHYYNYERIQGNGLTPYEERQLAFNKLNE